MKTFLTIAGFDPSSGAGVTADLAVFSAHGGFGTACVTALTVQTTVGVKSTDAVKASVVSETLDFLLADLPPAGIKIGMLATPDNVKAVAAFLERLRGRELRIPVVLDPVMRSSSGKELLSETGVKALRQKLLPMVDWITPNRAELGVLIGREVRSQTDIECAVNVLRSEFPRLNIVATGGDLDPASDLVMLSNGRSEWLRGPRIASRATHGTGCAFSSALLCGLAAGLDGFEAARQAKHFVAEAIRSALPLGSGRGPMNLLWPLTQLSRS